MRIVIDMQGAQTESRFRGIGRYTHSLVKALIHNRGKHEIILVFNAMLRETIPQILDVYRKILPMNSVCTWHAPGPVKESHPENAWRRDIAQLMRESYFENLQPDVVLMTSLFEGYIDDAVTSFGVFTHIPTAIILYDLIPLLSPDKYLTPNPVYQANYLRKIENLKRADAWLAISESVVQEGCRTLDLPLDRVKNISTACDKIFRPLTLTEDQKTTLLHKYGIKQKFILYSGGTDARKNLQRLVKAYSQLSQNIRQTYQLVFAGKIPESTSESLWQEAHRNGLDRSSLVFTDYVPDEELASFYNLCHLFILPSLHEGFGLPALEAMSCGAPVIGSNLTSLPEVIGRDDALFDPRDPGAIADKIREVIENDTFRTELGAYGIKQAQNFSWDDTARRALETLQEIHSRNQREVPAELEPWSSLLAQRHRTYQHLLEEIASHCVDNPSVTDSDIQKIAYFLDKNQRQTLEIMRSGPVPEQIIWRIEGPFDTSYSLALVNREIARALKRIGHQVILHSTEGSGDFLPSQEFLVAHPDLAQMHSRAATCPPRKSHVTSRFLYPPRVSDMESRLNFLHAYGWEETGFPQDWVEDFNCFLQGITLMSSHVHKIMIDNGVTVPLAVSGLGVDHWESLSIDEDFVLSARKFRFLHISSCFPRKGIESLLSAYGEAFSNQDDVTLVIKTFANPHNRIHQWLEDARKKQPDFPDVQIFEEDFTDSALKALYAQCHVLVSPSKAEGFGLPMAEAMLSGLAVITTAWGGQTDFCTPENAWLVGYRFARAQTHLALNDSVWAEPDTQHLAQVMREVYQLPASERQKRTSAGRDLLLGQYRWDQVAEKMVIAAGSWAKMPEPPQPRIGWISTWGTRCGIATYSAHLAGKLACPVVILAAHSEADPREISSPWQNVEACWEAGESDPLIDLQTAVERNTIDTVVVQFNYGFFNLQTLAAFLIQQVDAGKVVLIEMHATLDPEHAPHKKLSILVPALLRCHRILVHGLDDLNRLKNYGLVENVSLFPHGIVDWSPPADENRRDRESFTLASYGFFLPHKGLAELVEAVNILHTQGLDIKLQMINAEYPDPSSKKMIAQVKGIINMNGLSDVVSLNTEFLTDTQSLERLHQADLIVFPYQNTGESASGAVRYGIASGRPVAVTPLAIFNDVANAVFELPGFTPPELAQGIFQFYESIKNNDSNLREKDASSLRWKKEHRYSAIGRRLYGMLVALHRQLERN